MVTYGGRTTSSQPVPSHPEVNLALGLTCGSVVAGKSSALLLNAISCTGLLVDRPDSPLESELASSKKRRVASCSESDLSCGGFRFSSNIEPEPSSRWNCRS